MAGQSDDRQMVSQQSQLRKDRPSAAQAPSHASLDGPKTRLAAVIFRKQAVNLT